MVDSVQSEMVWSSLATVRAVAAELYGGGAEQRENDDDGGDGGYL